MKIEGPICKRKRKGEKETLIPLLLLHAHPHLLPGASRGHHARPPRPLSTGRPPLHPSSPAATSLHQAAPPPQSSTADHHLLSFSHPHEIRHPKPPPPSSIHRAAIPSGLTLSYPRDFPTPLHHRRPLSSSRPDPTVLLPLLHHPRPDRPPSSPPPSTTATASRLLTPSPTEPLLSSTKPPHLHLRPYQSGLLQSQTTASLLHGLHLLLPSSICVATHHHQLLSFISQPSLPHSISGRTSRGFLTRAVLASAPDQPSLRDIPPF